MARKPEGRPAGRRRSQGAPTKCPKTPGFPGIRERAEVKVLVTGATGCVGPRVVDALRAAGCSVRTLSLSPGDAPRDIDERIGDILDNAAVESAAEGMNAVVHLAGKVHVMHAAPDSEFERVNVGGTANLVRAARSAGVEKLVFFSTISVYGSGNGQILDENSPVRPETPYARTKLQAEKIVLGSGLKSCVLRCGAIYGPQMQGNYQQLVRALENGRFLPVGPGTNRRTLLHVRDAARAAVLALRHPGSAGRIFNVSDGEFHTIAEIISAICDALGKSPPRFRIPMWMAIAGSRALGGRVQARLRKYTEDLAVSSKRIQEELGFEPAMSLAEGWRESLGKRDGI
jgi:nucleoside-diphosphate-sugar epimerase